MLSEEIDPRDRNGVIEPLNRDRLMATESYYEVSSGYSIALYSYNVIDRYNIIV